MARRAPAPPGLCRFVGVPTPRPTPEGPGTTVQSLKYDEFELQPFPMPPLAEQTRIVAKVDELMALCDELESHLTQTTTTRRQLLEATLAEVLLTTTAVGMKLGSPSRKECVC